MIKETKEVRKIKWCIHCKIEYINWMVFCLIVFHVFKQHSLQKEELIKENRMSFITWKVISVYETSGIHFIFCYSLKVVHDKTFEKFLNTKMCVL